MKTFHLRAFSLIEVLVVVAIISIITSIVILGMGSAKNAKDVESASLITSSRLREAQTAALSGKQEIAGTIPCAYRFTWGSSSITTSYVYKNGAGSCAQSSTVQSSNLPSGVLFTSTGSIDFALPHGKIATAQSLTVQKGSASQTVCVLTNGRIEIEANPSSC